MSITVVDSATYRAIFLSTVADYINRGLDLIAARDQAQCDMDFCFQRERDEWEREQQLDYDEYQEEMNMGNGRELPRTPR